MRKISVVIITLTIVISGGLFSGCTDQKEPTNPEALHFIGLWVNITTLYSPSGVNRSTLRAYNFTDTLFNYSVGYIIDIQGNVSRYTTYDEGPYELKDGDIWLIDPTQNPPSHIIFGYSFNSNYTTLTLTRGSESSVFWKQ